MSYILEALKKSDQQRQRGVMPTLTAAPITAASPKQSFSAYYGLLAAALLCGGIAIGWMHPWQVDQPAHPTEPVVTRAEMPLSNQVAVTTSLPAPAEVNQKIEQKLTPSIQAPVAQAASRIESRRTDISPVVHEVTADTNSVAPTHKQLLRPVTEGAQEQKAVPLAELPASIQQEIPAMTVQLHSYSSNPANSIVSINSRMMKEGESLVPGLKLEQITADGVIFSYKGYRFQRGIW